MGSLSIAAIILLAIALIRVAAEMRRIQTKGRQVTPPVKTATSLTLRDGQKAMAALTADWETEFAGRLHVQGR